MKKIIRYLVIGLGAAVAFLDQPEKGQKFAQMGARLSRGSKMSFKFESWASATSILAGDLVSARAHAERSHSASTSFAPPMRYLSALYCAEGQYEKAFGIADELRKREPDFTLEQLRDDGYPSDSLRKANLLGAIPTQKF